MLLLQPISIYTFVGYEQTDFVVGSLSGKRSEDIRFEIIQKDGMTCKNLSQPQQSTHGPTGASWHIETSGGKVILIHSAFYDDRPQGGILPNLRLLSIGNFNKSTTLYCYVWYAGNNGPYIVKARSFTTNFHHINPEGMGKYFHSGEVFVEYIMSCKLPTNHTAPTHVSLTAKACEQSAILVPVIVPEKPPQINDFGICVGPSFGIIDPVKLVEWFELHKILGIKEFNIYNVSLSTNMNQVFRYYTSTKELVLNHMSPVIPNSGYVGAHLNTMPVLNHCLLKNMYRYQYIVVVDFDEYITPKSANIHNYTQLMSMLDQKYNHKPWKAYTFYNQYFFLDYPPDKSQPDYLQVLQQRIRFNTSEYLYSPKSFINPTNCMLVQPHYCAKSLPNVKGFIRTVIPETVATNHHYRRCSFSKTVKHYGKCPEYVKKEIHDDTMLRYEQELKRNVKTALAAMGL